MTAREILKLLRNDGWQEVEGRTKGSHVQLKHLKRAESPCLTTKAILLPEP